MAALLDEIQRSLLDSQQGVASALLKFKLLASRLNSISLELWVKHELEGYPADIDLPSYRRVGIHYLADFSGPFGSGVKNAPIPPYAIKKFAGDDWNIFELRQSISGIDALVGQTDDGVIQLAANNLIYLLQGNMYEGMACNSVRGLISRASLLEVISAVRSRMLDLTIELERKVPESLSVETRSRTDQSSTAGSVVNNITNQIVHGQITTINSAGENNRIEFSIQKNSVSDVERHLVGSGIPMEDAKEFSSILSQERPEDSDQPFGKKAKAWLSKSLHKAFDGTWTVGVATASKVLEQAALKYYGLGGG